MTSRRQFIQSGVALSALSSASVATLQTAFAAEDGTNALQLERFIFDTRFAEAYDTAQIMDTRGVPLSSTAGDLMDLWYSELDARWKQGPMALAGVTTEDALFVLETLANDHRMRVVFRGKHSIAQDGHISHQMSGPASVVAQFDAAERVFGNELANAFTACPLGTPDSATADLTTTIHGTSLRDVPLFSWIIAPRSAVSLMLNS